MRCIASDAGLVASESSDLDVVPNEVVHSRGRRLVAEAAVWSSVVVAVEIRGEGIASLGGAAVDAGVSPFVEQGLDQPLRFAVRAGPPWSDPEVVEAERAECSRIGRLT